MGDKWGSKLIEYLYKKIYRLYISFIYYNYLFFSDLYNIIIM